MHKIPPQLHQYPLIRVCSPNCNVHQKRCNGGKRPVTSSGDNEPLPNIRQWIENGGNYGVVARDANDLVVFDSDAKLFSAILRDKLPETFTVKSGGDGFGEHWYYECKDMLQNSTWGTPEGSMRTGGSNGWFVVGPGSRHGETTDKYSIKNNTSVAAVSTEELDTVIEVLNNIDTQDEKTPSQNSDHSTTISDTEGPLGFIRRDDKRSEIRSVLNNGSHKEKCWMVGWLHGAAGLHESEVVDLIMKEAQWDNLNRDIVEKQVKSVIKSSHTTRGTHYNTYNR